jgi:hypothetical protein
MRWMIFYKKLRPISKNMIGKFISSLLKAY